MANDLPASHRFGARFFQRRRFSAQFKLWSFLEVLYVVGQEVGARQSLSADTALTACCGKGGYNCATAEDATEGLGFDSRVHRGENSIFHVPRYPISQHLPTWDIRHKLYRRCNGKTLNHLRKNRCNPRRLTNSCGFHTVRTGIFGNFNRLLPYKSSLIE